MIYSADTLTRIAFSMRLSHSDSSGTKPRRVAGSLR